MGWFGPGALASVLALALGAPKGGPKAPPPPPPPPSAPPPSSGGGGGSVPKPYGPGGPVELLPGSTFGGQPDALDHLKGQLKNPQIALLLDGSLSMSGGVEATSCGWYAGSYNSGNTNLNKGQWMKATLLGCNGGDGILELWHPYVNFGIFGFGYSSGQVTRLERSFFSSLASKWTGTEHVKEDGWNSPLAEGLYEAGAAFNQHINSGNSHPCRPNLIIVISDGEADGNAKTFNFECESPADSQIVAADEPWLAAEYMYEQEDFNCKVDGNQNIETWTIGVGADGTIDPTVLQKVAQHGGGQYYHARNHEELSTAISFIISSWLKRTRVQFVAPTVQTHGFYSDNYAYAASFRMSSKGLWRGTVKKNCILPSLLANGEYDKTEGDCLFTSPDGETLSSNPGARDLFTSTAELEANAGGTGQRMLELLGGGPEPKAPYWGHRKIFTWKPDGGQYVEVHPNTWTQADSTIGGCKHHQAINRLHGYTSAADCATGDPVEVAAWPHADPLNGSSALLRYGPSCQTEGACTLVTGTNDGLLHFYDAASGVETSAIVPAEIWGYNRVSNTPIEDHAAQPTTFYSHHYGVDGTIRLFHHDRNGNDLIEATEDALLYVGLGRGGKAYYMIPVSELPGGVVSSAKNPPVPLLATSGTPFQELRDTWRAPWVGFSKVGAQIRPVVAFASGHVWDLDEPAATYTLPAQGLDPVDRDHPKTVGCTELRGDTSWCSGYWDASCNGTSSNPCYDGAGAPLRIQSEQIGFDDGRYHGTAYKLYFKGFDLGAGDELRVEDESGNLLATYAGTSMNGLWTGWLEASVLNLVLVTNGVDANASGFEIGEVQTVPRLIPGKRGEGAHYPTVYVLDAKGFNDGTPKLFAGTPGSGSVLLRFAKKCTGGSAGTCVDETTSPDLAKMLCPISAEVSAYTVAGVMEALYFGDECGQIWKAYRSSHEGTEWRVKRLANLNNIEPTDAPGLSKDYRKIFTKVDLVPTRCRGGRAVGVYFGTGNIQRPAARDELTDGRITNGGDLIGVIWDTGTTQNLDVADLTDVTTDLDLDDVKSEAPNGWYIRLGANERMLRDPIVILGKAYYKTYEPPPTLDQECGGEAGIDRIYTLDNCDGSPAVDGDGDGTPELSDRASWTGATDVGGGILLVSPRGGDVIVSHGDISKAQDGLLNEGRRRRAPLKLLLWRDPVR